MQLPDGISKLVKKGGGWGNIAKNAIKYSPAGLAFQGAKKLFNWMSSDSKKETSKKAELFGTGITKFTPIVNLLKQIITLMEGDIKDNKKTIKIDNSNNNLKLESKIIGAKYSSTDVRSNISSTKINPGKINSNVDESTVKNLTNNVNNIKDKQNELKKYNSLRENGEITENDRAKYELFLRMLGPVITEAILQARKRKWTN